MRILVVEDDHLLNSTLCYNLSAGGYKVDSANTKAEAAKYCEEQAYELAVLDINLPDGNGFTLCRELKEKYPDTAVIFLTANDMESDMLKGYELGADDYVTKPFHISVFRKKVSALLARIQKPQTVLTRQVLLEKLWDCDRNFVDEHALTVAISRIRSKIERNGSQYIKTVYGMGYMWIGGRIK